MRSPDLGGSPLNIPGNDSDDDSNDDDNDNDDDRSATAPLPHRHPPDQGYWGSPRHPGDDDDDDSDDDNDDDLQVTPFLFLGNMTDASDAETLTR